MTVDNHLTDLLLCRGAHEALIGTAAKLRDADLS
jgi:hypothetical protein